MPATASEAAAGPTPAAIVSRCAAGLLGGYAFVWGGASLAIAALVTAGMPFEEARVLCMMLAFFVYLAAFLWAFAARGAGRVWAVLAGGGVGMTALAHLLQSALVG